MMLPSLLLSGLLLLAGADDSVHILSGKHSFGQLITSSTLNWVPAAHYSASRNFVIGGFEIVRNEDDRTTTQRPIFVCRALHNGIWVSGGQREGVKKCEVTLTGMVGSYLSYHLLENVDSAARLSWVDWSSGQLMTPMGAVADSSDNKQYVARHVAMGENGEEPGQTHYVGTLVSKEPFGTITYAKENGEEGSAGSGQLLVETEPISYNLSGVRLKESKVHVSKRESRLLGRATLRNTGAGRAKVAEAFGYEYLYTLYWGQGHAMLKGLNTTVTLQNRTRLPDIKWGLDVRENRTGVYALELDLEPGTGVNVTLRGIYAETEMPYSGKLFSRYEDNATVKPRLIDGYRREDALVEVAPELGPVFFLGNLSLAPTRPAPAPTEPPPGTTTAAQQPTTPRPTPPTTTMPTTRWEEEREQRRTEPGLEDEGPTERLRYDDNGIPNRPPETQMQGDDGGPQSLHDDKAGPAGSTSGAHVLAASLGLEIALCAGAIVVLSCCAT